MQAIINKIHNTRTQLVSGLINGNKLSPLLASHFVPTINTGPDGQYYQIKTSDPSQVRLVKRVVNALFQAEHAAIHAKKTSANVKSLSTAGNVGELIHRVYNILDIVNQADATTEAEQVLNARLYNTLRPMVTSFISTLQTNIPENLSEKVEQLEQATGKHIGKALDILPTELPEDGLHNVLRLIHNIPGAISTLHSSTIGNSHAVEAPEHSNLDEAVALESKILATQNQFQAILDSRKGYATDNELSFYTSALMGTRSLLQVIAGNGQNILNTAMPLTREGLQQSIEKLVEFKHKVLPELLDKIETMQEDLGLQPELLVEPAIDILDKYHQFLVDSVVNLVEKTEGVEQTVKEGWLMPLGINLLVRNGSSTQNIDFGTFQVDRQATTLLDDTVVRTRREKQLERTSEAESQLNQTRLSQKACSDFFNTINQLDKDQKLRGLSPVEKQALSSDYKLIQDHVAAINPELDKMLVAILRFRPQTLGRAYSNHRTDAPNIKLWDKTMMSALSLIYSDNYFGPEYEATKAEERGNPRKLLADNENAIRIAVKQDVTNAQTRVDLVTETMRSSDKTQFFRTINRLASEHGNKPINELPEADRNAINKAFTPFRVHLNILESTKQDMKALALSERLDQALMSPNANQNRPVTIDELMAFKPLIEEHYSTIKTPVGAGNLQARPLLAEPLSIVENPRSNKSFLTRIADQHFAEYLEDKVTNDLAGSLESYLHPSVYKQLDFTPPASNSPSLVTKALGYSPINEALELKIAGVSETAKPYQILIDSIWLLRDMSASYEAMAKDSSNKKVSTREKAAHLVELAKLGYFLNNNAQQILRIVDKMPERLKHLVQHDINRVFDEIGMNPIEQGLNQEPPSEADLQFGQDIFNAILNLSVDATSLERITEEPSVQEKLRLIVQKPNELQTLLLEISNITKSVASNPRALKTIRNELVGTLLECSANVEHSLGINDSPISDEIVKHFDNLYSELAKEALDEEEALELVHGDHFITQRQLAVEEHRLASIELSLEALEPKTELHLQQFESFVNGIDYLQHIKQTTHQVPDEPAFKGLDKWSGLQVVKIQAIAIETLIDQEARTQQTNHAICQDRISLLQERLHEQQTEYKANVIPQINAARIEKAAKHERANELEDIGFNKALGLIKEGSKQLRVNGNVEAHLEAEKLYDVLNQNKKEYIEGRLDKQAFATNCQKATDSAEQGELGKVPMFKQVLSFIANVIISFCTIFSLLGKNEFEVVKPSSPKDTLNIHDMKKAMKSLHEQAHSTDEPLQDNHELDSENNPIDSENSLPQGEESLDEVESIHP